jgi:hypothetical protein
MLYCIYDIAIGLFIMAICKICGEEFSERRYALGYKTCLEHSEPMKQFTVAPAYNKGAYQLITRTSVADIGR